MAKKGNKGSKTKNSGGQAPVEGPASPSGGLAALLEQAYARGDFWTVHRLAKGSDAETAVALREKVQLDPVQLIIAAAALGVVLLAALLTLTMG